MPTTTAKRKAWGEVWQESPEVIVVRCVVRRKEKFTGWVLLRTDAHHDNVKSNHKLEKKHLDEAMERNALICDAGDLFCAMQGKFDPRSSKSELTPEQARRNDYLNVILNEATAFYQPYAANWAMISPGNHEDSILNRCGFDLTQALAERLDTFAGAYTGFVRFQFVEADTAEGYKGRGRVSRTMAYHHGYGGGGPVTRGVIGTNRRAVWYPSADVIWTGHTHDAWAMPIGQQVLGQDNVVRTRAAWHISTPGYKHEWKSGNSWAAKSGHNPKLQGAAWLKITVDKMEVSISAESVIS
jgi:hypothetical protein